MSANQIQQLETREVVRSASPSGAAPDGGRTGTLWVFAGGADTFVSVDDVVDLWEAA